MTRTVYALGLGLVTLVEPGFGAGFAGQEIAFLSKRDGNLEVYLRCTDGRELNLTRHPAEDYAASWSPDGRRLAFGTRRDGDREIYVMDLVDGSAVNLTGHPAQDVQPAWSPDGRRVAFFSDRDGEAAAERREPDLYVLDLESRALTRRTANDRYEESPAWSPDGRRIVFCRVPTGGDEDDCELFSVAAEGEPAEERLTERAGFDSGPSYSRDGSRLLFHGRGPKSMDVLVRDAAGAVSNLTADERADWQPAESADGAEVVWCTGEGSHEWDLWVMSTDGSHRRPLVVSPGRDEWPVPRPPGAIGGPCATPASLATPKPGG